MGDSEQRFRPRLGAWGRSSHVGVQAQGWRTGRRLRPGCGHRSLQFGRHVPARACRAGLGPAREGAAPRPPLSAFPGRGSPGPREVPGAGRSARARPAPPRPRAAPYCAQGTFPGRVRCPEFSGSVATSGFLSSLVLPTSRPLRLQFRHLVNKHVAHRDKAVFLLILHNVRCPRQVCNSQLGRLTCAKSQCLEGNLPSVLSHAR